MTIAMASAVVSLGVLEEAGSAGQVGADAKTRMSASATRRPLIGPTPGLRAICDWPNPYGPGLQLVTDHYTLYTTLLDPGFLRQLPGFMESAHQAYNAQLPDPIEPRTRSVVYLFSNRAGWEAFTRDLTGPQAEVFLKIQAGAYCFNGSCIGYDIGPTRTLAALGHEGWHQFTSRHFTLRLPSWLDEGIAVTFECFTYRDCLFQFSDAANAYRLGSLREAVTGGDLIPLEVLLATSPGEVLATDRSERVQAFYSQSYGLVRFLREAGDGKYLARYRRLVADGLQGNWPLEPSERAIAVDRNRPRTIQWNQVVGLRLFQYYVAHELQPIEREYLAFCAHLVAG